MYFNILTVKQRCLGQYTFPFMSLCDSTSIMADTNRRNMLQKIHECTIFESVVFILIIKDDVYINKLSRSGKCKVADKEMTTY